MLIKIFMLLSCLFLFSTHLKLESRAQFSALNDETCVFLWKVVIYKILLFD